ncbi:hypothetical protein RD792_002048 [Penstemon davidsonii]|uniref:BPM/SPOP BACK domain-containing protein n=1 Tax=Penstemon davidsonii TaxID=160366 RepID=A0ABR0DQ07_9LAMI|nr:hypothetical protein RD792_002048 [Penstemon davidsonii]
MTHLLAAADRYEIERLKSLCYARLRENIAIDTVASTLTLAEQHGCFQLKSICLEIIGLPKNLKDVVQTNGFKNLKENCPAVIDELFKFVARLRDCSLVSDKPGSSTPHNSGAAQDPVKSEAMNTSLLMDVSITSSLPYDLNLIDIDMSSYPGKVPSANETGRR